MLPRHAAASPGGRSSDDPRAAGSAIYYLLKAGERARVARSLRQSLSP